VPPTPHHVCSFVWVAAPTFDPARSEIWPLVLFPSSLRVGGADGASSDQLDDVCARPFERGSLQHFSCKCVPVWGLRLCCRRMLKRHDDPPPEANKLPAAPDVELALLIAVPELRRPRPRCTQSDSLKAVLKRAWFGLSSGMTMLNVRGTEHHDNG